MAVTQGFGLVISLDREAVEIMVQLVFSRNVHLPRLKESVPVGNPPMLVAVDLTAGEPEVRLTSALPNHVTLLVPIAGTAMEAGVEKELFVEAEVRVPIDGEGPQIVARMKQAEVVRLEKTFGDISDALAAALTSTDARSQLQALFRAQEPLALSMPLGTMDFPLAPLGQAKVRARDDALMVGIDLVESPGQGNAGALQPFHFGKRIAVAQSARAVELGYEKDGPAKLQASVGNVGTVKAVKATLHEDAIGLGIQLDDTLVIVKAELEFSGPVLRAKIVNVNVIPPAWVTVLTFGLFVFTPLVPLVSLTLIAIAPLVAAVLPMLGRILDEKIDAAFARRFEVDVGGNAKAVVVITQFQITPDEIIFRADLGSLADEVNNQMQVPRTIPPNRSGHATLSLRPGLVNEQDRSASLLWKVTNTATGQEVLNEDRMLGAPGAYTIRVDGAFPVGTELAVQVEVVKWNSRAQGSTRLVRSGTITIVDRLDSAHPFVKWSHYVRVPQMVRVPGGGPRDRVLVGVDEVYRNSKIHKTHLAERCRDADSFSEKTLKEKGLQYLDSVAAASPDDLCKACFG